MRVAWLALVVLLCGAFPSALTPPLVFVSSIALPGVSGRIDHLAFDPATERLFVAALGNNSVEVIDTRALAHIRGVTGFHEPQGVALAADDELVVVANGETGDLTLIDRQTLDVKASIALGDDPDNVRYDAAARRVFVGYGTGALAAVDLTHRRRIGAVALAGHPESFQLEAGGVRAFVNVPTAHQIAVVDRAALKLLDTWPVRGASSNFPMALDAPHRRLFVGCREPAMVLVYDTGSGRQIAAAASVGDADDLFYDTGRQRLYVSGGEGRVDVFEWSAGDRLVLSGRVDTAAGARTSLFVPEQRRLYVAVPRRGAQKAEIRVYRTQD